MTSGLSIPAGLREQFEDAWLRYLPKIASQNDTTTQPASAKGLRAFSIRHTPPFVSDTKTGANPHGSTDVSDVSDRSAEYGAGTAIADLLKELES